MDLTAQQLLQLARSKPYSSTEWISKIFPPAINPTFKMDLANFTFSLISACIDGDLGSVKCLTMMPWVDVNAVGVLARTPFYFACLHGHLEVVKHLSQDPRVKVDKVDANNCTPFYAACQAGQKDVVAFLVDDPRIDVNHWVWGRKSPLQIVIPNSYGIGSIEVMKILLDHPRVDVNLVDKQGRSALWAAVDCLHTDEVPVINRVKLILASLKKVDTSLTPIKPTKDTASQRARVKRREDVATLIDDYERNPSMVRKRLRRQLGYSDHDAAGVFALVVFFCDDLLTLSSLHPQRQ